MLIVAAPSESPAKLTPVTLVAGVTRLPLASNVMVPESLADAIGSWMTEPEVDMFVPVIVRAPAGDAVTVTPVIPAAVTAVVSAAAYVATDSLALMAGAAIVAVLPPAVGPVMVRLVPAFTVARVPAFDPKL